MEYVLVIAAPILLALVIAGLRDRLPSQQQGWLLAGGMALVFGWLLLNLPVISEQGAQTFVLAWVPQLGLTFSLYVDGLALMFALVISGIGISVMLYAGYYFDDGQESGRFYMMLLSFTASMLALVLAGNLLTLFIAWELTSIISFLLISFKGKEESARSGASQALLVTGGGGLALLAGLLLIGSAAGSYEMADLLASGDLLRDHAWYTGFTILVMIGCFSKSAQFPLHFWLPGAMSAPTPASAFLHSATMVKAGVYLLARLYPVLSETVIWETALVGFGLTTVFIGAFLALRQRDLKGILAYTTISQLGTMVALLGLPQSEGKSAAMVGILAHALYKGAFFLVAGAIDHATGTRDILKLGGLRDKMPGFAAVTAVVGLSMAGAPPLFGFVAKEKLLEAFIDNPLALAVIVASAAFMVTCALRLFWEVFVAPPREAAAHRHDDHGHADGHHDDHFHAPSPLMATGPGALAVLSVVAGVGIAPLVGPLVSVAVGKPTTLYLFPPEGINTAFLLSMTALVAGFVLFMLRGVWLRLPLPQIVSAAQVFQATVRAVEAFGDLLLRSQGGKIRYYLVVILLGVLILLSTAIFDEVGRFSTLPLTFSGAADLLKVVLLGLALLATLGSILFRRHLLAVLALGAAGYAVGGLFVVEPAPDVAMVQFLVETLVSVLIIIILARTSDHEREVAMQRVWGQTKAGIARDVAISVAMGAAVTIFALAAVNSRPTPDPISQWHLENALPQVGVNDVVAGILTDFRATDTLIEISVFGIAALGVLTMLARPRPGRVMQITVRRNGPDGDKEVYKPAIEEDAERPETLIHWSQFSDPITRWVVNIVLPLALMLALAHLLFAGKAPGDGFTAGVIAGLGVAMYFVVLGYDEAKRRLRWLQPAPLVGGGMALAIINALLPLLFGRDFFAFTELTGISFADVKFASSLVFEIGIFMAVTGGIGTIMEAISHPKEVEPL